MKMRNRRTARRLRKLVVYVNYKPVREFYTLKSAKAFADVARRLSLTPEQLDFLERQKEVNERLTKVRKEMV